MARAGVLCPVAEPQRAHGQVCGRNTASMQSGQNPTPRFTILASISSSKNLGNPHLPPALSAPK